MLPSESAMGSDGSDDWERTAGNLRERVSELESALLAQQALLRECRQNRAIFENAALERLEVIERSSVLLRNGTDEILALQQEAAELRLAVDRLTKELSSSGADHTAERKRLQGACREAGRGMEELASRERLLTSEILELRNEGLLHSTIRRLSSLFS